MKQLNQEFVWFELNWQRPFALEDVTGLLAHLSQLTPRGFLCVEARSKGGNITYLIGTAAQYSGKISEIVRSHGEIELNAVKNVRRKPMSL
ncbi:MAG: hypothetical protein IJQ02_01555, partial [Oscillospiraceae bacterium]|nr:hypothetical protein [Oscillospiraceae bacterium]